MSRISLLTEEERLERRRQTNRKYARENRKSFRLKEQGMTSPSKVVVYEPVTDFIKSQIVMQEGGSPSFVPGFYRIGDGAYRRARSKGAT